MKRDWTVLCMVLLFSFMLQGCDNSSDTNSTPPATSSTAPAETPTPEPTISPTPTPTPVYYSGDLELPVEGATGYMTVSYDVKSTTSADSTIVTAISPGTAFVIVAEDGDWWNVENESFSGWVQHRFCMINLPDVIPSIIYYNTNTYQSKFKSSGKDIPNITGQALYSAKSFNNRLDKDEYIIPVLYAMSKKIYQAQQIALSENNSLLIYEGYRPYSTQEKVVQELTILAANDSEVMAGINTYPWSTDWFIATNVSNHQMGYAIDVSLAHIVEKEEVEISGYSCVKIKNHVEYEMPTQIHELSAASATFTQPVASNSEIAWKDATYSSSMNDAAKNLQRYCTNAGLTPLASEWWHFNDLNAMRETEGNPSRGDYEISLVLSR